MMISGWSKVTLRISLMLGVSAGLLTSSLVQAYEPPVVPKYYEEGDGGFQQGIKLKKNYLYGELLGGLGRSLPNDENSGARLAYGLDLRLGYVKALGSWSHLDASLGMLTHQFQSNDTTMPVPIGVMGQIGYGYSIYHGVSAVLKFGVGAVFSRYHEESAGITRDSNKLTPGLLLQGSYMVLMPVTEGLAIDTGIAWKRAYLAAEKAEVTPGPAEPENRSKVFNSYEFLLGLRTIL
jgi:hypothetical protein